MRTLIQQFWYLLDERSKKNLPYLFVGALFLSMLDVVNLGLMGLFLGLLTHSGSIVQKYIAVKGLKGIPEAALVVFFGLFIISVFFMKTYFSLYMEKKIVFFCRFLSVQLKERLMSAYQHAPYSFHLQTNSATMMSKLHNNIDHFALLTIMPCMNLIANTLVCISITFFLAYLHPLVTLILILSLGIFGWHCDRFTKKQMNHMGAQVSMVSSDIIKAIYQSLHGFIEIRVLGREQHFLNTLKRATQTYAQSAGTLAALQLIPRYLIENMMVLFIVGLSFGGLAIGLDTTSIVVMAGLFAAAGVRLLPLSNQMLSSCQQIRSSYQHAKLIYDDLVTLSPVTEERHSIFQASLLKQQETHYRLQNLNIFLPDAEKHPFSKIELRNVSYCYSDTTDNALEAINLTLLKGQSIGIIGPSGAGKSTLINLLVGMLKPDQGAILVDEKPITSTRAWLNNFAYLPQTIFLLDDSVRRNIAFGIEDQDIEDEQIWKALEMAQLMDVVTQLPQQLDTFIGENGIRLSGGQRQRIALARAFYHQRDILVLDEATSSLDRDTEKDVIDTLKGLKGQKTLVIIAHRLSTVEHCDKLFYLKKGRLFSSGSYEEVIHSS